MTSAIYYTEAFIEEPGFGYRFRIFNDGEGMIRFEYQEYKDGTWIKKNFDGLPVDSADQICEAVRHVAAQGA